MAQEKKLSDLVEEMISAPFSGTLIKDLCSTVEKVERNAGEVYLQHVATTMDKLAGIDMLPEVPKSALGSASRCPNTYYLDREGYERQ